VSIEGGPVIFVEHGDGIDVQCKIKDGVEAPQVVTWYHSSRASVTLDQPESQAITGHERSPWTIRTDRLSDSDIRSTLRMERVDVQDSGVYFCHPYPHVAPANVSLRVLLNGKQYIVSFGDPSLGLYGLSIRKSPISLDCPHCDNSNPLLFFQLFSLILCICLQMIVLYSDTFFKNSVGFDQ
jgi:hypothetical protein